MLQRGSEFFACLFSFGIIIIITSMSRQPSWCGKVKAPGFWQETSFRLQRLNVQGLQSFRGQVDYHLGSTGVDTDSRRRGQMKVMLSRNSQ